MVKNNFSTTFIVILLGISAFALGRSAWELLVQNTPDPITRLIVSAVAILIITNFARINGFKISSK